MSTPSSFRVIVADPPWEFGDKLDKMKAGTARSAASNYPTLDMAALKALPIDLLADEDAVLALWTPCSLLAEGLELMSAWGFRQVQEWIWVKLTTDGGTTEPLRLGTDGTLVLGHDGLLRALARCDRQADVLSHNEDGDVITQIPLAFGMGRLARAAKESCLIGVRGSPYKHLMNRSQRDVFFGHADKHSEKPEEVQDMLDRMFPAGKGLELFARRQRVGWTCIGNEAPATMGEDIRDSVKRLLVEVRVRCRLAAQKDFGRRGLVVLTSNGELTHGPSSGPIFPADGNVYVLDPNGDHEFPASIELRRALAGGR